MTQRPDIFSTLESLRSTLKLSHRQWADVLGLAISEYGSSYLAKQDTTIPSLSRVSDILNISVEAILKNNIDYNAVYRQFTGKSPSLPERYEVSHGSRIRTARNALNYLTDTGFGELREALIKHTQLNEAILGDIERPVGLNLMVDIWDYLRGEGFNEHDFHSIGLYTSRTSRNRVRPLFADARSVFELFVRFFEYLPRYFDSNCDYQIIKTSETTFVLFSSTREQVADELKVRQVGSQEGCHVRAGVFASVPAYLGLPFSKVRETKCVHRKDDYCKFEFDFEYAHAVFRSQQSSAELITPLR